MINQGGKIKSQSNNKKSFINDKFISPIKYNNINKSDLIHNNPLEKIDLFSTETQCDNHKSEGGKSRFNFISRLD